MFGATSIGDYHRIFAFRRNVHWKKEFNQGKTGKRQKHINCRALRTFKVVFKAMTVKKKKLF